MFEISEIRIQSLTHGCVTDNPAPEVSFSLESDIPGACLADAEIEAGGGKIPCGTNQTCVALTGLELVPFTEYPVRVTARDNHGSTAVKTASFQTGRLATPWTAAWITDSTYQFPDKTSPAPMTFQKRFPCGDGLKKAFITATALGIYELTLNGEKVGNEYFAPGLTSYPNVLQYQYYDVTHQLREENILTAVVGGGWAVGRFTYESKSKITAPRQALLLELWLVYENGETRKIVTDPSWRVTEEGNYRFGDFYDGETYDATVDLETVRWRTADICRPKISPELIAAYGSPVTAQEQLSPVNCFMAENGELVYDFGQNFAGVVCLDIQGKRGQKIVIRHSEALSQGTLHTLSLRSAKQTVTYICKDGHQRYSPRLTYMGFRYIGVSGVPAEDLEVSALALHSDFEEIGSFSCSNELLNRLQSNVRWSGKSNLVDIPTDCPQRDERQGWTGDIAVFASTACFNFSLGRFLGKWLNDVRLEQGRGGGIPVVVPRQGSSVPVVATACWGDCCVLVPWAEYLARGSALLLRRQYPTMKRFLKAAGWWARLSGPGQDRRRIWKWLYQYGDWCAPKGGLLEWMKKGKWIATAYYANSCAIVSRIAGILGESEDQAYYSRLYQEICRAYQNVFTDGAGRLKREFQTAYVLPLYFEMVEGTARTNMAANLSRLVRETGWHLTTGFPGTPYLLFALADNGYSDDAYRLLLQDTCPSWLYEVKAGGTTFWEQWDTIRSDGTVGEPSLNHYAYGAVGDFLYRRIVGLEPLEGGYRRFAVRPVVGGGLTWAKAQTKTPYGLASAAWELRDGRFMLTVQVPVSTLCEITLPSGRQETVSSGTHIFEEPYHEKERP